MAFNGELEHLSIIDIIQLLQNTGKSGVLVVRGEKGESRLVFSEGHLVGANYLNGRVRIGRVLEKLGLISAEDLESTLAAQKGAGAGRKPLLATLVELGRISRESALKGLRKLVELTVVELVSWKKGTFSLDTAPIPVSEQISYVPGKMDQEIYLDAQGVLMEALRIFDEKKRDGRSGELIFSDEELAAEEPGEAAEAPPSAGGSLTVDDLGLADIDKIERKVPKFFTSIEDVDRAEMHRQKIGPLVADLPPEDRERLVSYLAGHGGGPWEEQAGEGAAARGIILFSRDELLGHAVMTVTKRAGALVFVTSEAADIAPFIESYLSRGISLFLVFDEGEGAGTGEELSAFRREVMSRFPELTVVQLSPVLEFTSCLGSYAEGVRACLPRPSRSLRGETFVDDTIAFLDTFRSYAGGCLREQGRQALAGLRKAAAEVRGLTEPSEISLALLRFVAEFFPRALTLVVREESLVAERAIGISPEGGREPTPPLKFAIPLGEPSAFAAAAGEGTAYFGNAGEDPAARRLYEQVPPPRSGTVLLLPLRARGRTVAITYGDFGREEDRRVPRDALEILAEEAGLALDNAFFLKQLGRRPR